MKWSPARDSSGLHIKNVFLANGKLCAKEHSCYRHAQQHWAHHTIDVKQCVIEACTIHVAVLGAVLVGNGLNHKAEENENPQPVSTAKAGTVEQWKRSEKCSAKGHQCGESQLPLAP